MTDWHSIEGSSYPLGVHYLLEEDAYNFALYTKTASAVTLLLYAQNEYTVPVAVYQLHPFRNKSQRTWHCRLKREELAGALYYAYRVEGALGDDPSYWHRFNPDKILCDPYARELFFPPGFSRAAAVSAGSNAGKAPLGCLPLVQDAFDWEDDKPVRHTHDLVIYEMHVRGFTKHPSSGIAENKKGTFAGVIEKIPYLQELGITAVELMPVHQFDPDEKNYWGYMTLNFFAPHQTYSSNKDAGGAVREFKAMVKALHKAGIEVILDVVYNHTTEAGNDGPCYSFKGIDNSAYYLLNNQQEDPYENFSGTGNTLRTDHPAVQAQIMDSLRYWVQEMHVDGFRFDLASVFTRRSDGTVGESPVFAHMAADPELNGVRLIAEPWDARGVYQLGRAFPGIEWFQWNGRYRDDIRQFVKSDAGMLAAAIRRLYGSDDLFPDDPFNACRPYQSVNFLTAHDGFTLYDLLAYSRKYNEANGHNNTDGHEPNYSWNCGWEGDEGVPQEVMNLRLRQAKNCMTLLMLSNGTPMFLAGDEFLQTQKGNNNPYNQDNETSWLAWNRLQLMSDHFAFVKKLIAFRKMHPSISRSRFWREGVQWYGTRGQLEINSEARHFAFYLSRESGGDADLYVMVNAHWEGLEFDFMEPGPWKRVINTFLAPPEDFLTDREEVVNQAGFFVGGRSVVVFRRT
jgi:glycogen operon protein